MKKLITILLLCPLFASSQFKVTVIIDKVPSGTGDKSIYIMGNFNEWSPADPQSVLVKDQSGKYSKTYDDVQSALYEFKFTLGSMESVECKADGSDIANRQLNLQSDTTIHITIARWKNTANTASVENKVPARVETVAVPYRPERLIVFKPE